MLQSIFLADDDADDLEIVAQALSEIDESILFTSAIDGHEALTKLTESNESIPDIILLDLNMPKLNGIECLQKLKTNVKFRQVPVMIFSTSSLERDIDEALSSGAAAFIIKPNSLMDIISLLKEILNTDLTSLNKRLAVLNEQTDVSVFAVL